MNGPLLRDIHLPPASWWPPAPGWWCVAGIVVLGCLVLVLSIAWRRRRSPLRAALHQIDMLEAAHAEDNDDARLADAASRLMRRIARRIEPVAATRSGAAWRAFVHRHAREAATREALDGLIDVRYRVHPSLDAPALLAALRAWCRQALGKPVARDAGAPVSGTTVTSA